MNFVITCFPGDFSISPFQTYFSLEELLIFFCAVIAIAIYVGIKIPSTIKKNSYPNDAYQMNDPIFGMDIENSIPAYPSISKPSLGLQIAIFILVAIFLAFPLGAILFH